MTGSHARVITAAVAALQVKCSAVRCAVMKYMAAILQELVVVARAEKLLAALNAVRKAVMHRVMIVLSAHQKKRSAV